MSTDGWVSPLPAKFNDGAYHVWKPGTSLNVIANKLIDRAWRGRGVRLYWWPCGTAVLATIGSGLDRELLAKERPALYGTYAHGALLVDVMADLRDARRSTR